MRAEEEVKLSNGESYLIKVLDGEQGLHTCAELTKILDFKQIFSSSNSNGELAANLLQSIEPDKITKLAMKLLHNTPNVTLGGKMIDVRAHFNSMTLIYEIELLIHVININFGGFFLDMLPALKKFFPKLLEKAAQIGQKI